MDKAFFFLGLASYSLATQLNLSVMRESFMYWLKRYECLDKFFSIIDMIYC